MPVAKQSFLDWMERIAPVALSESWDNVGLLIDAGNAHYSRVLLALDPTEAVANEAVALRCDLIVTHHPILLRGVKRISQSEPEGRFVATLLQHGISHFAAHTNLDSVRNGVNDILANAFGLSGIQPLIPAADRSGEGMGRIGTLPHPRTLASFAEFVKKTLSVDHVVIVGDPNTLVSTVAVCGGSGADLADEALKKGADVLVTGDVRHHAALDAHAKGLALIDAGHFATESPVIHALFECLQEQFDQVQYQVEFLISCAGVSAMQSI